MTSAPNQASAKPPLLFLVHRIPYPPNKGDKIRSFNILKHLSRHFSIYLGTFVDDADDWQYCPEVRRYCTDVFFEPRHPRVHKLLALRGLLTGQALSVSYYASRSMQKWVDTVVTTHSIQRAMLFCSPMMQFVMPHTVAGQSLDHLVIDFVDMDSEKWRQYAEEETGPVKWLYQRETDCLFEFECHCARLANYSYFVSAEEALLFRSRSGLEVNAVGHFFNGVDVEYFTPSVALKNPYGENTDVLVFTGAMDYRPNIDAVVWFANQVFPGIRKNNPRLQFWIVGGKPSAQVKALGLLEGVEVTGRVQDIRPYIKYALAAVAPMLIARGIQNKVLEAMAMGRLVLASPEAVEGIGACDGEHLHICSNPDDYKAAIGTFASSDVCTEHRAALNFIRSNFRWENQLAVVATALLEQAPMQASDD